jgi:imidazolonepropionase-like amidohydrolase
MQRLVSAIGAFTLRTAIVSLTLAVSSFELPAQSQRSARRGASPPILIHAVTIIDGSGAAPRKVKSLLIQDGLIDAIGELDEAVIPETAITLDLDGKYVVPGLIDGHTHIGMARSERQLTYALRRGITTVRSMGDDVSYVRELQDAIASGDLAGPSIYFSAAVFGPLADEIESGPILQVTPPDYDFGEAPWARVINADTDLADLVSAAKGIGAQGLKLYTGLEPKTISRLAHEGQRQGLRIWAHSAMTGASAEEVANSGIDLMTHVIGLAAPLDWNIQTHGPRAVDLEILESERLGRTIAAMADNSVLFEPTLTVLQRAFRRELPPAQAEARLCCLIEVCRRAKAAGIAFVAGTDMDLPRTPDATPGLITELDNLVAMVGLSPLEAIRAATLNGAIAIGIEDTHGSIAVGKVADLVVLNSDPSLDLATLNDIAYVIKNGRIVDR